MVDLVYEEGMFVVCSKSPVMKRTINDVKMVKIIVHGCLILFFFSFVCVGRSGKVWLKLTMNLFQVVFNYE